MVAGVSEETARFHRWHVCLGWVACVGALWGCGSDAVRPAWNVRFEQPSDRDRAVLVENTILEEGCSGAQVVDGGRVFVVRGEAVSGAPPELSPGRYGFRARARASDCSVVAEGCVTVELPRQEPIVVSMQPVARPSPCPGACDGAGWCMGEPGYRGPSGRDSGAGRSDAGSPDASEREAGAGCGPCAVQDASGRCDGSAREGAACAGPGGAPGICRAGACGTGCWDGSGWQPGDRDVACGRGGVACRSCGPCERCGADGGCEPVSDGTNCTDATSGAGKCLGGACCVGCVSGEGACVPISSQDFSACGIEGASCMSCPGTQVCCRGVCKESCS